MKAKTEARKNPFRRLLDEYSPARLRRENAALRFEIVRMAHMQAAYEKSMKQEAEEMKIKHEQEKNAISRQLLTERAILDSMFDKMNEEQRRCCLISVEESIICKADGSDAQMLIALRNNMLRQIAERLADEHCVKWTVSEVPFEPAPDSFNLVTLVGEVEAKTPLPEVQE